MVASQSKSIARCIQRAGYAPSVIPTLASAVSRAGYSCDGRTSSHSWLETMSSVLHAHAFLARCFDLAHSHLLRKPLVKIREDLRGQLPAVARPRSVFNEGSGGLAIQAVEPYVQIVAIGNLICTDSRPPSTLTDLWRMK